ncbi:MAG: monofunctional biosynthetic peptidoglycan transglycosylase [Granulosicoccus sp.]|jgi:monofunctional biosynthetic peptidoglycan transglycosylase
MIFSVKKISAKVLLFIIDKVLLADNFCLFYTSCQTLLLEGEGSGMRYKTFSPLWCFTTMKYLLITFAIITMMTTDTSLFEFQKANEMDAWRIVNDGVMGGRSQSKIAWNEKENTFEFSGDVSMENNGGFASVRAIPQNFNQREFKKIKLRVKGDGKIYKFRMRNSTNFDGIVYSLDFETENGQWKEIELALDDFQPTFRGRIYSNYGKFDPMDLQQIGFLIAGKQEGKFHLEVDWVRVGK